MNRKGEALVEAVFVIPLVILVIASLLTLLVFFYSCLMDQVSLHSELLKERENRGSRIEKIEKTADPSGRTKGITEILLKKRIEGSVSCFRETVIIRAGEIIL